MDSPILKELAKFLHEKKTHRRWMVVFVSLAVIVGLGTAFALKMMGQAMTRKEKVLVCAVQPHTHTEECQDAEGNLICGLADYIVHTHNDDCYDSEGNLACQLAEVPVHQHEDACYAEEQVLICGQEESEGHLHSEECYESQVTGLGCIVPEHQHSTAGCFDEEGNLICEAPEHQHSSECYDEMGNLICGQTSHTHAGSCFDEEGNLVCTAEEHLHDGNCLMTEDVLICEEEEGAEGHTHTEECYEVQRVLACGQFELHMHSLEAGCYEEVPPAEEGGEVTYRLICGLPQLEEHIHTEEAGCFEIHEAHMLGIDLGTETAEPEQETPEEGVSPENPSDAAAEDAVTAENPADVTAEEPAAQSASPEEPDEFVKTYNGEGYVVTAIYGKEAELPEEAELIAELITPESDKEHYAEREAEYKEQVGDEDATMSALLKVGFYINGEEIEPKAAVKISVQMLDENGLPEGMPMTVVHFAEEGNEVLKGSQVENGKTSFEMNSFSEVALGHKAGDRQIVKVNKTQVYNGNRAFQVTFHLTGEVKLPEDVMIEAPESTDNTPDTPVAGGAGQPEGDEVSGEDSISEAEEGESDTGSDESSGIQDDSFGEEVSDDAAADGGEAAGGNADQADEEEIAGTEDGGSQEEISGDEEDGDAEDSDSNPEESILSQQLEFRIEPIEESSEEYKAIKEQAEKTATEGSEVLSIFAVSYALVYNDRELELSGCEIEAEVTPTKEFGKKVEISMVEAVAYLLENSAAQLTAEQKNITGLEVTGLELDEDGAINQENTMYIDDETLDPDMQVSVPTENTVRFFAVRASGQPNPKFTVQYYANLNVVAYNDPALRKVIGSTSYTNELPVIDTTGGKMPKNGGGTTASPNGNEIRNLYVDMATGKLQTKTELTEVYSSRPFEYHKAPTINYMNALVENPNYELKEVWVLKEGKKADSTNKNDWDIHTYSKDLHFTNRAVSAESGEYVLISDGATMRFVYDTTDNDNKFETAFYDYDIGDGMIYSTQLNAQNQKNGKPTSTQGSGTYHMHTKQSGINSPGNYTGSGAKLAFGNANTGSGLQHELWGGNLLNKHNGTQGGHPSVTGSYKGCTFGLVTGLVDGKVQYAGNVNAPNLFNDGSAAGKTSYDNGEFSLTFNRVGDTFTLTTVNGTGTGNLDTFNHPSPNATTVHNHIWTNNFWPMDSAASFGTDGHDMKFGDYTNRENYKFAGQAGSSGGSAAANGTFPWSDDGEDHNSYFGMHYNVEFDLVKDYVGPLEYYFFGDDDMWVFLDGRLVCDIGGVHSSVGEYVNLWDYLEKGSEASTGKHTLSFFYTERGESGSTCWMQFTLPSVSSLTPETSDEDFGHLKIEKTVTQVHGDDEKVVDNGDEFTFTVRFTDANGKNLPDDYSYVKYDKDGNEIGADLIIWDGGTFTLKNGEYIIVKFLPQGTKYKITEANAAITVTDNTNTESKIDYFTDIKVNGTESDDKKDLDDNKTADGEIPKGDTSEVNYNNKFYLYELPKTGGFGKTPYTMAGVIVLFGAGFLYRKKFRERRV